MSLSNRGIPSQSSGGSSATTTSSPWPSTMGISTVAGASRWSPKTSVRPGTAGLRPGTPRRPARPRPYLTYLTPSCGAHDADTSRSSRAAGATTAASTSTTCAATFRRDERPHHSQRQGAPTRTRWLSPSGGIALPETSLTDLVTLAIGSSCSGKGPMVGRTTQNPNHRLGVRGRAIVVGRRFSAVASPRRPGAKNGIQRDRLLRNYR